MSSPNKSIIVSGAYYYIGKLTGEVVSSLKFMNNCPHVRVYHAAKKIKVCIKVRGDNPLIFSSDQIYDLR